MKYNIINVNADNKKTFTNKFGFIDAVEELRNQGYKRLTILERRNCVNAYYYKESEK